MSTRDEIHLSMGWLVCLLALCPPSARAQVAMSQDEIVDRARSGVGFSYWWAHGKWTLDPGADRGSCSGSCPGCTHYGSYGADCSNFVYKVWWLDHPAALEVDTNAGYSGIFYADSLSWTEIPWDDVEPGDAFVRHNYSTGSGHVLIYSGGKTNWGGIMVYEARGCAYGIIHQPKSILGRGYKAIRRANLDTGPPELAAELVGQGSDAMASPNPDPNVQFAVCSGQNFTWGFEMRNVGQFSWVDWPEDAGVPGLWGHNVRLGRHAEDPDPLSGLRRISVNDTANSNVIPPSWNPPGGDCNDAPLCQRTIFFQSGTAPFTPGLVRTDWQLVDEGRAWFGPEMWLSFDVVIPCQERRCGFDPVCSAGQGCHPDAWFCRETCGSCPAGYSCDDAGQCQHDPLGAELVAAGSDAALHLGPGADYRVCTGQSFRFWFDIRNVGWASWVDWAGEEGIPEHWGHSVRLGVPGDQPDPLARVARISVNQTANDNVHPPTSEWEGAGENCNDRPTCSRTVFDIRGRAPSSTGIVHSQWQLVDELRTWFGPVVELGFEVVAPSCQGRECGPDPVCGVSCGTCRAGYWCNRGTCQPSCEPDCSGRECGPDPNCMQSCGACDQGFECVAGQCCQRDCQGRACGPDGCGGTCPPGCAAGERCEAGACVEPCQLDCANVECGPDPTCADRCGPDPVCDRSCGFCEPGRRCDLQTGLCVEDGCKPDCEGRQCGLDPVCGTVCGVCAPETERCDPETGVCETDFCEPDCQGLECGPDPVCWQSCGACDPGFECVQGTCQEICMPDCRGIECGPDPICGQSCGVCPVDHACAGGRCEPPCAPDCLGRECGPDPACGLSCGVCEDGMRCEKGLCVEACGMVCQGIECGPDPECSGVRCGECQAGFYCVDGHCVQDCLPYCEGRECGPDRVCGQSCGQCEASYACEDGQCKSACQPACEGLDCGLDPVCYENCGDCPPGTMCFDHACVDAGCTPACQGRQCGPDGCSGSCGECPVGLICDLASGQCRGCPADCRRRVCGPDPVCGQSCGQCSDGYRCNDGQCEPECQPDCEGRECGPDPRCGILCGTCPRPLEQVCVDGRCQDAEQGPIDGCGCASERGVSLLGLLGLLLLLLGARRARQRLAGALFWMLLLGLAVGWSEGLAKGEPGAGDVEIGPELVLRVPWGTTTGALGRLDGYEAASEGPMSFAVSPDGDLLVLDQNNLRVVRFDPDGKVTQQLPLPDGAFEDIGLSGRGEILLLDRWVRSAVVVLDADGKVLDEVGVVGAGIPEGGGITAMLVRKDGVWLEYLHARVVRIMTEDLTRCDRSTRTARIGMPDGASVGAALDGQGGAHVQMWAADGQIARQKKLAFGEPIRRIVWMDTDEQGRLHAVFHLLRFEPGGFEVAHQELVGIVLGAEWQQRARFRSPHCVREWEQFIEFRVTPGGEVVQMAFTDAGVEFLRWRP
ncbi:MAG: hypothetical protein JXR96_10515 [Deltaproteobacteria bacterium]|nr:hypothetical protein [Deltaproteobacteria bacterium]